VGEVVGWCQVDWDSRRGRSLKGWVANLGVKKGSGGDDWDRVLGGAKWFRLGAARGKRKACASLREVSKREVIISEVLSCTVGRRGRHDGSHQFLLLTGPVTVTHCGSTPVGTKGVKNMFSIFA
jgi:hypothetical protein